MMSMYCFNENKVYQVFLLGGTEGITECSRSTHGEPQRLGQAAGQQPARTRWPLAPQQARAPEPQHPEPQDGSSASLHPGHAPSEPLRAHVHGDPLTHAYNDLASTHKGTSQEAWPGGWEARWCAALLLKCHPCFQEVQDPWTVAGARRRQGRQGLWGADGMGGVGRVRVSMPQSS